jgi:hypothetical protein
MIPVRSESVQVEIINTPAILIVYTFMISYVTVQRIVYIYIKNW